MDTKDFLECAETAFSDLKIIATQDQIEQVAQYFEQEVENGFDSRGDTSFQSCKSDNKPSYESLETKIEELENRLSNFRKEIENCGGTAKVWIGARTREIKFS